MTDWRNAKITVEYSSLHINESRFTDMHPNAYRDMFFSVTIPYIVLAGLYYISFFRQVKKPNIPYGGIAVALTWGMGHWLTKATLAAGLYSAFGGFCFGTVYLLLNRNIKLTYGALCIMFIL